MSHRNLALPFSHLMLALFVTVIWGTNFVVIKFALDHLPPLLFGALRFIFAFFPAVFFIRRPPVAWLNLAAYGVLIGAGQFGLLYIAMKHDISPGLASLVIQTQIFFTIGLSMWFTGERVKLFQIFALALAVGGLGVIAVNGGHSATPFGLTLILLAAFSWGCGNTVAKAGAPANMLAYVVWGSLFSFPPLLALSFIFEGWPAIESGILQSNWMTWAAVIYQSVANTLFGYAAWGWLLARHPAAIITPVALLIPIFGMSASALILSEPLPGWKLAAIALVISGLALNLTWPKLKIALSKPA
ncbi:MAG: EamA family transporter [Pseudomonadota bacterium]